MPPTPVTSPERRFVVTLMAAVFLLTALPASASHTLGYRWHGNPPITLALDTSRVSDPRILAAVEKARVNWSLSSVLDLDYGTKGKARIVVSQDALCGIACAEYKARNGYFAWVTVHVNPSASAMETVLCHEIGHGLGLAHQSDLTSCMYPTTSGAGAPNAHDYEELEAVYG